jgi:radical SAM protein with 4Fe4S-binding SPASM domain
MEGKTYVRRASTASSPLWGKKRPLLIKLEMELTERCNLNCIHCYINLPAEDLKAKSRELSAVRIKEILKEAASLGCLKVRFTGGEPLLREDFEDIYIFARKLGLKVTIFTNATLIHPRFAKLWSRIPPGESIEVSVYGMTRKSYESVTRHRGSFAAFQRGFQLLLKKRIPFIVKGVILPQTLSEIGEFESWASRIPQMEAAPRYAMFFDLRGRRDGSKNKLIEKLRISAKEEAGIFSQRQDEINKDLDNFCQRFLQRPSDRLFTCGAGRNSGCVDAYGKFQMCLLLRHPETVVDLKQDSMREALNKFFPELQKRRATNLEYLARCARCFLRGLCEQCPAKSWMESGTLDSPVEYLCEIAHERGRRLGLLGDNERSWEVTEWKERVEKDRAARLWPNRSPERIRRRI